MTYHAGTPINGLASCYPSAKSLECGICSRYRTGYAMPAEQRAIPIIDASVLSQAHGCPMYAAIPMPRPFHEVSEPEGFRMTHSRAFAEAA